MCWGTWDDDHFKFVVLSKPERQAQYVLVSISFWSFFVQFFLVIVTNFNVTVFVLLSLQIKTF